jgi:poly-gamma-glutamate synthase PgsB/CapB
MGILEFRKHQRNLLSVPVRIHVNGTRGKSSVTRLIAAGMRAGGIRTLGKTTGTKPTLIFEDGSEAQIARVGKANIVEYLMVFRRAVSHQAQAIVLECMAVQPALQLLSEKKMVKSTIGVLTNVRADHLDEMGPTLELVAKSLCNTVPENGILFTTERNHLSDILEEGKRLNCKVVPVSSDGVTDQMISGFTYIEHRDNVALALAVCQHLGIDRGKALEGMHKSSPDPGVLRIFRIDYYHKKIEFVNAFAANDPDSYSIILELLKPYKSPEKKLIILVNGRDDRIQRSEQLGELIAGLEADHFLLVGTYTTALANKAMSSGLSHHKIMDLGGYPPEDIFEKVLSLTPSQSLVIGIGNIVGLGEQMVTHFANRGREIVYRSS